MTEYPVQTPPSSGTPSVSEFTSSPLRNRLRVELDAPVLEVWELMGDLSRYPEYSVGLERVEAKTDEDGRCKEQLNPAAPAARTIEDAKKAVRQRPHQLVFPGKRSARPDHSARSRIGLEGGRMTKIWGLSKRDANYGPAPTPDVRCARCKYMFPPLALGGCRLVRGVISGSASCKEFVPRRPAPTEPES